MKKIVAYEMVESDDPEVLSEEVTELLKKGFELYGYHMSSATNHYSYTSQALVKYEEVKEKADDVPF